METLELSRHCIPWTPFRGALAEARVCLVTSAGVRLRSDTPFDASGDQTWRQIPGDATGADLAYDDEHYDHACADADVNCIFPIDRLRELAAEGRIGSLARAHFAYGFSTKLRELKEVVFPRLVREIEKIHPDVVLLTGG